MQRSQTVNQQQIIDSMIEHPVIAAVRDSKDLPLALSSPVRFVFFLSGSINTVKDLCDRVIAAHKACFLHIDLLDGLKTDAAGLQYIYDTVQPTGIITTKTAAIRHAKKLGLITIQRVFLLDSTALAEGAENVRTCQPDLVEVLPGLSAEAIQMASEAFNRPLIAGGLIQNRGMLYRALSAGALAVSTGRTDLWYL